MDFKYGAASAGSFGRIIERAEETFLVCEQFHDFFLVPQMIAAGDDVHAGGKNFLGNLGRDAVAAGGVFAVGNDEIELVLFAEFGEKLFDRVASGLAYDVADEEQFHAGRLNVKPAKDTKKYEIAGQGKGAFPARLRLHHAPNQVTGSTLNRFTL